MTNDIESTRTIIMHAVIPSDHLFKNLWSIRFRIMFMYNRLYGSCQSNSPFLRCHGRLKPFWFDNIYVNINMLTYMLMYLLIASNVCLFNSYITSKHRYQSRYSNGSLSSIIRFISGDFLQSRRVNLECELCYPL